jgi:hypothetical protein
LSATSTPSPAPTPRASRAPIKPVADQSGLDHEPLLCQHLVSELKACHLSWVGRAYGKHDRHEVLGSKRIIAFYGSPLGRGLGVLGNSPPEVMLKQLRAQAGDYQAILTGTQVVPAFQMVTTIADGFPGPNKIYSHQISTDTIRQWIDFAQAENVWVILDLQPGRSDLMTEFDRIAPFLYEANVQLAIDPEFMVGDKGVPGQQLGRIDGETINRIQERLDLIAQTIGLTKVLIVHQFDDRLLVDKDQIENYWLVEMVWDADGFGPPGPKLADYNQYRHEAGFEEGGLKLFYVEDKPLMTPQQVMKLEPKPSLVIYQ